MNLSAYAIYIAITAFVILRVGWLFYHFGAHYLHDIFPGAREQADNLNRLLLLGYYLLNLGYVAYSLSLWPALENWFETVELLSQRIGFIVFSLGAVHFFNLWWVRIVKRYLHANN